MVKRVNLPAAMQQFGAELQGESVVDRLHRCTRLLRTCVEKENERALGWLDEQMVTRLPASHT